MERLRDLAHDLGKYLRLPLSMLPAGASPDEVRRALDMALHETRRGAGRVLSARVLWHGFRAELAPALGALPAFEALERAVERALAWEGALQDTGPIDRAAAERDLRGVGEAIETLIEAAEGARD